MGQAFLEVHLILPERYDEGMKGRGQKASRVPFTALPRVGDWVEWGARPRRVLGIVWGAKSDDGPFYPRVYLEDAPLDLLPEHSPMRLWEPRDRRRRNDNDPD